ncbi:MAG: hypothetical protein DRP37_01820 [Thermodesulfobacteriota bacterium]|nr:MAG: hypothetical protein DRP37_01820 [Thermodesulfobacteriota bacterium]
METESKGFRRESCFQWMPFIANNSQQGDLIAELTNFPASCIARGIVGPVWEHKKPVQRKCLYLNVVGLSVDKVIKYLNGSGGLKV